MWSTCTSSPGAWARSRYLHLRACPFEKSRRRLGRTRPLQNAQGRMAPRPTARDRMRPTLDTLSEKPPSRRSAWWMRRLPQYGRRRRSSSTRRTSRLVQRRCARRCGRRLFGAKARTPPRSSDFLQS